MKTKNYFSLPLSLLLMGGMTASHVFAQPGPKLPKLSIAPKIETRVTPAHPVAGDSLSLYVGALSTQSFVLKVYNDSDSLIYTRTVTGGRTALPLLGIGKYRLELVNALGFVVEREKFQVFAPKVASFVTPLHITVGDTVRLKILAQSSDAFKLNVYTKRDSLISTSTVVGGINLLAGFGIGNFTYTLTNSTGLVVDKGRFAIHAPKVRSTVSPSHLVFGDTATLRISSATTNTFTLNLYSKKDSLISSLSVLGGANVLPILPVGNYKYELINTAGIKVDAGKFEIVAPKVKSYVTPRYITVGDTVELHVVANQTETFRLDLYTKRDSLLSSSPVRGGSNLLPNLTVGVYSYALVNSQGIIVDKGRFEVHAPKVASFVTPLFVTVGDTISLKVIAAANESFTAKIYIGRDSLISTLNVKGGINVLPALGVGHYHYELINAGGLVVDRGRFDVKAPKVVSFVTPYRITLGDTINIKVLAPSTQSFKLNIYVDSIAAPVRTLTVAGGSTSLPSLEVGRYKYELIDAAGYIVDKGRIEVSAPKIKSNIAPNPSFSGQGSIVVDAPITDKFTLFIYSTTDLVSSEQISGGTTLLPSLAVGVYHYKVVDASSNVVSKGRIVIVK